MSLVTPMQGSRVAAHDVGVAGFHFSHLNSAVEKVRCFLVSLDLRGPSTSLRFAQDDEILFSEER